MAEGLKNIVILILHIPLFFHLTAYKYSKYKHLIDEDISILCSKRKIKYKGTRAIVYILLKDRYYRNIFYNRIGWPSIFISWYLPRASLFFPCKNIGGGVYPAHPYSTVLNAKRIGKNFSFRQCTTLGNKKDGEGTNGPVIGDNVNLGANVCIIGDIRIGNNVIVGAGSVIVKDVPDNVIVAGNPAKIIRQNK